MILLSCLFTNSFFPKPFTWGGKINVAIKFTEEREGQWCVTNKNRRTMAWSFFLRFLDWRSLSFGKIMISISKKPKQGFSRAAQAYINVWNHLRQICPLFSSVRDIFHRSLTVANSDVCFSNIITTISSRGLEPPLKMKFLQSFFLISEQSNLHSSDSE